MSAPLLRAEGIFASASSLDDGRQSERALTVQRGMRRYLRAMGFSTLPEFTVRTGRRADLLALGPDGAIWIIEIKSSLADLNADQKWPDYLEWCDRFAFATLPDVDPNAFPADEGLFVADGYGASCLRDAIDRKLAAARRKSITLAASRMAMDRLHRACDPDIGESAFF